MPTRTLTAPATLPWQEHLIQTGELEFCRGRFSIRGLESRNACSNRWANKLYAHITVKHSEIKIWFRDLQASSSFLKKSLHALQLCIPFFLVTSWPNLRHYTLCEIYNSGQKITISFDPTFKARVIRHTRSRVQGDATRTILLQGKMLVKLLLSWLRQTSTFDRFMTPTWRKWRRREELSSPPESHASEKNSQQSTKNIITSNMNSVASNTFDVFRKD